MSLLDQISSDEECRFFIEHEIWLAISESIGGCNEDLALLMQDAVAAKYMGKWQQFMLQRIKKVPVIYRGVFDWIDDKFSVNDEFFRLAQNPKGSTISFLPQICKVQHWTGRRNLAYKFANMHDNKNVWCASTSIVLKAERINPYSIIFASRYFTRKELDQILGVSSRLETCDAYDPYSGNNEHYVHKEDEFLLWHDEEMDVQVLENVGPRFKQKELP